MVVVGSGCAGISAAAAAAGAGRSVAVVAKDELGETNTHYAQGGVAAVLHPEDSFDSHIADTIRVARGIAEPAAVEQVIRGGPAAIRRLIDWGAQFDCDEAGELELLREGGHSNLRIVHAGGAATGLEIQRTLLRAAEQHPDIACFENTFAIDLLTGPQGRVIGVLCLTARWELVVFSAGQVILANGGAGQLYRETTNPSIATGDGLAIAFRAGAILRDLEFVQFHPTCLYIAGAARVLISEVVRGAGGLLRDREGVRFMPEYHERGELAPRDVVSRACFDRMVQTQDTSVYLDLSEVDRDPHELFPGISRTCRLFGIDIATDPIPVRPGAHYMIGGVQVDAGGRTNVAGLWAVGECASSGLHGANRMGSNSLLEGLVLGTRAGELAAREAGDSSMIPLDAGLRSHRPENSGELRLGIEDMLYSLKSLMWRQMGIARDARHMGEALDRIGFWTGIVQELSPQAPRSWELINLLTIARLAAHSALAREESRGAHYRTDFPEPSEAWRVHTAVEGVREGEKLTGLELRREPVSEAIPHR